MLLMPVLIILTVVGSIIGVTLVRAFSSKAAVERMEKFLNNGDCESMYESMLTYELYECAAEMTGEKDLTGTLNDLYQSRYMAAMENYFGKGFKAELKIAKTYDLSEDEELDLKDECRDYYEDTYGRSPQTRRVEKVRCDLTISGRKNDLHVDDITLYLVKIRGRGRVICPLSFYYRENSDALSQIYEGLPEEAYDILVEIFYYMQGADTGLMSGYAQY